MIKIFGKHAVYEFIKTKPGSTKRVFILSHTRDSIASKIINKSRAFGIPISFKNRHYLDKIVSSKNHQGVVAEIVSYKSIDIEELINASMDKKTHPLFILLDRVQDPNNLGSILRTAVSCGVDGVVVLKDRSVGLTPAVVKSSAGAFAYAKICEVINMVNTVKILKDNGFYIVGTHQEAGVVYTNVDYNRPVAIIIGGEEKGMRRLVKENCDEIVKIPIKGGVNSLNVGVSAGVVLYEVLRQRLRWCQV